MAGASAAIAAGGGVLSSCSNGDNDAGGPSSPAGQTTGATSPSKPGASRGGQSSGTSGGGAVLPAYTPSTKVEADLPASDLIPAAFFAYPDQPVAVTTGTPGQGETVNAMIHLSAGAPPSVGKNPYWQELNKRLGVTLKVDMSPLSGWSAKVQTRLAGGDLPDLMQLPTGFPNIEKVLTAEFEDLAPFLGGDAVNSYPALAALSTGSWRGCAFNGGLYGIPVPLTPVNNFVMARSDIVKAKGLSLDIKSGQDFLTLCENLTDARHNKYAIGVWGTALLTVQQMVGVPNKWKVEDGQFTSQYETDEYKQSLDIVNGMRKSGVLHPDAFSSTANLKEQFGSGTAALVHDGGSAWPKYLLRYKPTNPDMSISGVILPKWDGSGQSGEWCGRETYTFCALKKTSDADRVKMLLAVMNWLAAPFGSAEYLFAHYGVPDRDYTLTGSDPVPTDAGVSEVTNFPVRYLATAMPVLYFAGQSALTKEVYDFESEVAKVTVPYPLTGLNSETQGTKGATIDKNIRNAELDIMQGRKPVSSWDGAVKAWRSGGGDEIRKEYEQSYAAAHQ